MFPVIPNLLVQIDVYQNMKNLIITLLLTFILFPLLASGGVIDFYKKGTITLQPDSSYGVETNWEELIYDTNRRICLAPDGSLFVSNSHQHNIYKFSPTGQLLLTFGQKGLGPGDLYFPGQMDILDSKYLVVAESPEARRISIFDLSGKYSKVLKTTYSVFGGVIALKNNKIAYYTFNHSKEKIIQTIVFLKDIQSGKESTLASFDIEDKSLIGKVGPTVFRTRAFMGKVFIRKTKNGNLLLGVSNSPDIKLYSHEGKLLRSFKLNISRVPVTKGYIDRYKAFRIRAMEEWPPSMRELAKKRAKFSYDGIFSEYLPYYRNIFVDSEGNILVFKWTDCIGGNCVKPFQVYSPEGALICETQLNMGKYDLEIKRVNQNIAFSSSGIYTLVEEKDEDADGVKIIKTKIK